MDNTTNDATTHHTTTHRMLSIIYSRFEHLRLRVYIYRKELEHIVQYLFELRMYLRNTGNLSEYRSLYILAHHNIPIYVSDAHRSQDGILHSDTHETLATIKRVIIQILAYEKRLVAYIHALYAQVHDLLRGIDTLSGAFNFVTAAAAAAP